ncbi:MAG: hypothetical protein MJD61_00120 [Proteobacteria bacterium]|nr:hypothetical protein [Pseudomonadota bacterium]
MTRIVPQLAIFALLLGTVACGSGDSAGRDGWCAMMSDAPPYPGNMQHAHIFGCMDGISVHEDIDGPAPHEDCRIEYECLDPATRTGCVFDEIEADMDILYTPRGGAMEELHGFQIEIKGHNFLPEVAGFPARYELGPQSAGNTIRMDFEVKPMFHGRTIFEESSVGGGGSYLMMHQLSGTVDPQGILSQDGFVGFTFFAVLGGGGLSAGPSGDWIAGTVNAPCSRMPDLNQAD